MIVADETGKIIESGSGRDLFAKYKFPSIPLMNIPNYYADKFK